jgi:hypothetical protein
MSREVIQLNNDGVTLFQMGKITEACTVLTNASSLLGRCLRQRNASHNATGFENQYSSTWIDLSYAARSAGRKQNNDDSLSFLFLRALRVEANTYLPVQEMDCPLNLCWAVLYNLALSCHILACQNGAKGKGYLKRAHDLYEIVRTRFVPSEPSEQWATLSMALFNNAGCIYREFAMHNEYIACLGKVRDMLLRLPCENRDEDFKIFSLNLMVLQTPTNAAAA